ncbi:MAG: hypothetical protein QXJ74_01450 [Nitrososphaera sp.]|uniref:hypothetical protein n=1 Tax=Nitrososphaera sp. TaxID=1971748 RepID=UPI0017BCC5FA|nr:hypothetical protein [Nitrososphaera sp.]NWG37680.1 hypothetical protein [Nitrososphaera sp.]
MEDARVVSQHEKKDELFEKIDSLVDQTLQIYELNSKEGAIIRSIDSSISMLLNTLRTSLPLSPEIFHSELPGIKSAVLNNSGEIIIMQASGNIVTKKFSELQTAQVMEIVREIVPKLSESADAMKASATEEIALLKKVAKQFQRVKTPPQAERQSREIE